MKYFFIFPLMFFTITLIASSNLQANANNPYKDFRIKTYEMQQTYLDKVTAHQDKIMQDLENKLSQQKWQTNAIAVMVFIMVGMGLILSYMQFKRDGQNNGNSSISLKLGSGNLELTSSVIGLAILALSFWFFQTYVNHVYSVKVFDIPIIDLTTFGVNR